MHLISQGRAKSGFALAAAFIALAAAGRVQAGPLNLVQQAPDVTSSFLVVSYASGILDILGTPVSFDVDGVAPPDYSISSTKSFHLSASINPANGALVSGTVSITGKIPAISAASGSLLTGNLTAFGFPTGGGDIFEFKFNVTGGDLASYYHSTGGIIVDAAGSNFHGSFTTPFTNDPGGFGFGVGVSDTFIVSAVPEASSLVLAAASFGALLVGRKIRRRRQG